jgi:hypothetical protein
MSNNSGPFQRTRAGLHAAFIAAQTISQVHTAQLPKLPDVTRTRVDDETQVIARPPTIPSMQKLAKQEADLEKIRQEHRVREGLERGKQLQEPLAREERPRPKRSR